MIFYKAQTSNFLKPIHLAMMHVTKFISIIIIASVTLVIKDPRQGSYII